MEDDCVKVASWRSDDGYPFCDDHAYAIYVAECEMENLEPHNMTMWIVHDRPHGPIG